jgi:predicted amidohydrolase
VRVAAIELPARHDDAGGQLRRLDAALASLAGAGPTLAVLPELALTGYVSARGDFDASRFAEPVGGPLLGHVAALAVARGVAVLASWVERDGASCFNACALLDEAGAVRLHYRKRHPWFPERWATPGDLGTPTVTLHGMRFAVAVCFDVHFVTDDAGPTLDAVDALLFPSAWCDDDAHDLRGDLLPALAVRHGCAVVNANWGRGAPAVPGQGGSRIVGPGGATLARAPAATGVHVVGVELARRSPLPPLSPG